MQDKVCDWKEVKTLLGSYRVSTDCEKVRYLFPHDIEECIYCPYCGGEIVHE